MSENNNPPWTPDDDSVSPWVRPAEQAPEPQPVTSPAEPVAVAPAAPTPAPAPTLPPAGWYPDPADAARQRFWDGAAWTAETRAPGQPAQPNPYAAPQPAQPVQQAQPVVDTRWTQTGAGPAQTGLPQYRPSPTATPYDNPYAPTGGNGRRTADGVPLAGWWWRVLSVILDGLIFYVIQYALLFAFIPDLSSQLRDWVEDMVDAMQAGQTSGLGLPASLANEINKMALIITGVELVYALVLLGLAGGTLGQLACGLRVVPTDKGMTKPLPWGAAFIRVFAYTLISGGLSTLLSVALADEWQNIEPTSPLMLLSAGLGLLALLNYLWPLWDGKRQTLHDKIARTQVVKVR